METLDGREKKNPQLMLKNNVTLNWSKHFLSLINQSSCMMAQSFENKVCSTVKIGNLRKAATFIRLWWRTYWTFMTLIRSERVASGMQWASPHQGPSMFFITKAKHNWIRRWRFPDYNVPVHSALIKHSLCHLMQKNLLGHSC